MAKGRPSGRAIRVATVKTTSSVVATPAEMFAPAETGQSAA